MAVLQTIRSFFVPDLAVSAEPIIPAPTTEYSVKPLTSADLKELLHLNVRCFTDGDSYNKHTLSYLLNEPRTLSYQATTAENELAAFVFVMVNDNGAAHLTTIGVAPEHRRRGLAKRLLEHAEATLRKKDVGTIMLEVRVGNLAAQDLYRSSGFTVVQRITGYYNNGEDCYLMMKSLL
jgi:ribosomal-protein-alanine acetyltransferase